MLPAPRLSTEATIFEPADYTGPTLLRYLHLIGHDPHQAQHFLSGGCRQPFSAENTASDRMGSESLARYYRRLALAADAIPAPIKSLTY